MFQKGINIKDVNLSGIDLPTDDATKSALIYNAVKNTYGFPILLNNFKINGTKRDAVLVSPIVLTDSVVINLGDYYLTISATAITATAGVNLIGATIDSDGDVEIGKNLEVDGTSTLTGDVSMGGDATITGDASIGGDATITDDVSIGGDADITGDLNVTGDIKGMEKIVDSDGNKRFIGGDLTLTSATTRVTKTYGKWYLSGNHFMVVACIEIESGDEESNLDNFLVLNGVPNWISDKVIPLSGYDVDVKSCVGYSTTNLSTTIVTKAFFLTKYGDNILRILPAGNTIPQTSNNSVMRIQFDLVID